MVDKAALGKRIKECRKKAHYTQDVLAEKADITVSYLGELERGEKTPSLDVLIALANALTVTTDYLLRDNLISGPSYIDADISEKLSGLTQKQRITAEAILDAYIQS